MNGMTAGELRLTGGPGFGRILDFSMREYPGEHSRAELTGTMEASEGGTSGFPWLAENSPVGIHVDGMERALYNGIIQKAESREENGYCLLRLELCSGSILLDLFRVGDLAEWDGKQLPVCAREAQFNLQ